MISPSKVEGDYRFFFAFMIFVMAAMYVVSLMDNAALRQPLPAALFTILLLVHILLHLKVSSIIQVAWHRPLYIIGQAALAFGIIQLSGNIAMILALYMALIGECVGFLGLTRWAALTTFALLALSFVNILLLTNTGTAIDWFAVSIPTVIFVSLYVSLYIRQTEARAKAQALAAELETANRQLSEYAARVEDLTITAERQRMARELHDTLSQGLAGLILQLEAVDAHLGSSRVEKARAIVSNAMLQARATLADARRAIDALRQASPDDLETALRLEISHFEAATALPCAFHAFLAVPIPDDTRETIIRAVSEGLTNIAHHAQAKNVTISLTIADGTLTTSIQDDGVGFDTHRIPSGHYGLIGLRERIRLVNGQFNIVSHPGQGTTLEIKIPLIP